MGSSGGLYITGNTTAFVAPNTAAQYTTGWAAFGSQKGDQTVVESASGSKLTLKPGRYFVTLNLTVETEDISGSCDDDTGIITFGVRKDGTQVTGLKAKLDSQDSDRPHNISIAGIVTVASTDTGDLTVYVESNEVAGNDICISEGQFCAHLID